MATPNPQPNATEQPWHIGDRIRKIREMCGYRDNRSGFADLLGIHRDSLAKYERNSGAPKKAVINSIELATGARPEWILRNETPIFKEGFGPEPVTGAYQTSRNPRTGGAEIIPIRGTVEATVAAQGSDQDQDQAAAAA